MIIAVIDELQGSEVTDDLSGVGYGQSIHEQGKGLLFLDKKGQTFTRQDSFLEHGQDDINLVGNGNIQNHIRSIWQPIRQPYRVSSLGRKSWQIQSEFGCALVRTSALSTRLVKFTC